MKNIEDYLKKLQQEIETRQLTEGNGGSREQIFTRIASDILKKNGETDNVAAAFDEKRLKSKLPHKINAFSISEDMRILDLFITVYFAGNVLKGIGEKDLKENITLVENFYRKAADERYALDVPESAEIFECAHEIGFNEEFRNNIAQIRITVLTNGCCPEDVPSDGFLCGTPVTYRIFDIEKIYSISEEAASPIDIDIRKRGYTVPCVCGDDSNDVYRAYLAIIPGKLLAELYGDYGVRLMENNVRQFLQFTGKINRGIKETIDLHPEMFLAYNNGIAATASEITLDAGGKNILSISNLQIVNGGQTTASLYYAGRVNPNADLSRIAVQAKISVIKKDSRYRDIVKSISTCANSQNKVGLSDFSANDPRLERIEKMSRFLMAPETKIHPYATFWYFERYRAQYKNLGIKEGFTKQKEEQFRLKYPTEQVFGKFELAKYINSFNSVYGEGKCLVGPHVVCQGNEKCYDTFLRYSIPNAEDIDNIWFEDLVAKAIIFKEAERRYGTKNDGECIGDIRKTVVAYTMGLLNMLTDGRIDLYRIWTNQMVSASLSDLLYDMMTKLNRFFIEKSPSTRVEEWGKREECWNTVKEEKWEFNLGKIKNDLLVPGAKTERKSISLTQDEELELRMNREYVEAIPSEIWDRTAAWGNESGQLNLMQQITAKDIARKIREDIALDDSDVTKGIVIADILSKENIDLLYQANSFAEETAIATPERKKITMRAINDLLSDDLIERMLYWDRTRNILKAHVRKAAESYVDSGEQINPKMKWALYYGLLDLEARGFKK